MDYEGKSILQQTTDPQNAINTADIIILKREVAELQEDVKNNTSDITTLHSQVTSLQTEEKKIKDNVTDLQTQVATLGGDVKSLSTAVQTLQNELQNAPSISDCGSLVLTCPVSIDTGTVRVTTSTDWDGFYYTGYSPPNSQLTLTSFVAVNFQKVVDSNPTGLYWTRPTGATGDTASFEIDATASFIPSVDMAVRIGVQGLSNIFDATPLYDVGYNEQRYRPSANVASCPLV